MGRDNLEWEWITWNGSGLLGMGMNNFYWEWILFGIWEYQFIFVCIERKNVYDIPLQRGGNENS